MFISGSFDGQRGEDIKFAIDQSKFYFLMKMK